MYRKKFERHNPVHQSSRIIILISRLTSIIEHSAGRLSCRLEKALTLKVNACMHWDTDLIPFPVCDHLFNHISVFVVIVNVRPMLTA